MTLTEFLLARLDEDEEVAKTAQIGGSFSTEYIPGTFSNVAIAHHIARHYPARVLAEVDAKREMMERCQRILDGKAWPDVSRRERSHAQRTLDLLALPYADHPDYREEWRP